MNERPWLKHYPAGVDWFMDLEPKPVFALLDEAALRWPDRPHMSFMGRVTRYRESAALVDRLARGLQDIGVGKGVHVGIYMPNCPQFILAYYAILKAGGTVVNFSPLYSVAELKAQVADSETDIMVTLNLEPLYANMERVLAESRLQRLVVAHLEDALPAVKRALFRLVRRRQIAQPPEDGSHASFRTLLANDGKVTRIDIDPAEDVAVLQYTGGTTGTPKGAMLTHANLAVNAAQTLFWDPSVKLGEEVMLGALPLFHVFAMTLVMNAMTMGGGKIVLMPKFELEEALRLVAKEHVTLMPGVPTMFTAILNHPRLDRYDLSSLKSCFSGGAPLPAEIKRRFEERVAGVVVNEGYGLTEASPTVASNPIFGLQKSGSIGLPVPRTEILFRSLDDPERDLPQGETGELCVRGPQVMKGYWKRPDETAKALKGGVLHTGDIGYMDADGYSFIVDRAKDLILVGGFNVYPRVIEEAIYRHPAVREVTVIGVPDPYLGEVPKAFVVRKEGQDLDADALLSFLRGHLGKHEMPRAVEFRDALPKTMVGKLSKKELVAEERAKYEAGEGAARTADASEERR
ncbi:MAG: long-chain fatty acid--CoA ligase [Rhodothalassiaceae bacterium]